LASAYFAQALDPESAEAYNVRGLVLEELGQPGAAAEAYQKASRLDPSLAVAGENLQELEAELAEARQLVVVASFLHPLEAHIATAILEASGIRTFLAD
jgi:Flp pilus assembly protein TadD